MSLLHPAAILQCDVERWMRKKVILAAPLPHMEVQLSAQPLLTSSDGLFEWSAQPLRDRGMKKREDGH